MERMREVLNEFTRFMNPHLRLCSRLSQQQFIFSPNASFERIFSRQRGESIDQHIRSNTKSDKFVAKKDHSLKSQLVVKRYYKSPSRQSCQPCIHFTLLVEEEHVALSWLLRYDKIFPSKSLPSNATFPYKFLRLRCISRKLINTA